MRTSTVFRDQLLHSYFDLKTNTEVPYFFQSLHPHPILNHHRTFSYNVHGTETENSMKRKNNAKDGLISVCRRQCEEVRNSPANEISMHYSSIQHSDRMDEDKCILYWAQTKLDSRKKLKKKWQRALCNASAILRAHSTQPKRMSSQSFTVHFTFNEAIVLLCTTTIFQCTLLQSRFVHLMLLLLLARRHSSVPVFKAHQRRTSFPF